MIWPGASKGTRVRRFTVPAMPPSIMFAEGLLNTSTPTSSSGGISAKLIARPLLAENVSRPFNSLRVRESSPRTVIPLPSIEKWSGSTPAANWLMVTPGTRCSVSVTLESGSAPISWAEMESWMMSESFLRVWASFRLCRMPVMTTS
jgi:hypothetical protein